MALPLPSSPHWAPRITLAGNESVTGPEVFQCFGGEGCASIEIGKRLSMGCRSLGLMAQRHPEAEERLLKKWICMNCSATHRGSKPRSCRKCNYTGLRKKAAERRKA